MKIGIIYEIGKLYYRNDTKKLVTIGGIVYKASKNKLIRRNSLLKRMYIIVSYFISVRYNFIICKYIFYFSYGNSQENDQSVERMINLMIRNNE